MQGSELIHKFRDYLHGTHYVVLCDTLHLICNKLLVVGGVSHRCHGREDALVHEDLAPGTRDVLEAEPLKLRAVQRCNLSEQRLQQLIAGPGSRRLKAEAFLVYARAAWVAGLSRPLSRCRLIHLFYDRLSGQQRQGQS